MKYVASPLHVLYIIALVTASPFIPFETAGAQVILEEVIVTARKREESLQDIPISVQAFAGEQIAVQSIIDLQSLAAYTPGFMYTPSPGASDIYFMRGLGTFGSGSHFEPGVGQVFNGYFSTRSRLGRSALIDVAQIEVLKGPQGAIIGKNTSLGAINITSNKPTEEFEAELVAQYNILASEGFDIEGMISGPITDRVRGRAVINYRDVDGWVTSIPTGEDIQQQQDLTARVMLDIDITDSLTAEFMYQRTDFDRQGKARVETGCQEFTPAAGPPHSIARAQAAGFDCVLNTQNNTADLRRLTPTGPVFNSREPFTLENDMFGVTFVWEGENFDITSLSAYTAYDITDMFSGDQRNIERVTIQNTENYSQFYQEIRLNSTAGETFDYTAGVMYFNGDMDMTQTFHAIAGVIGPPVPAINPAVSRNEFFGSTTESIAGFGQIDWHFNDQFTLAFGGRVTDEDRTGYKAQQVGEVYTGDLVNLPIIPAFGRPVGCNEPTIPLSTCTFGNDGLQPGGTALTGEISKTNFSYNVSLQYSMDDDNTFYFTHATGFKSGGFDLRGAGAPSKFIFGEEESTSFEIGGKHTLLDGTLRLNWTLFHTEVDDLQTAANDPIIISQIVAAADVTSQGIEVDILWAPTDALRLTFTGTLQDAEYDRFLGSCYLSQPETGTGCLNVTVAAGNRTGVQDLAGQQAVFAPDWSSVLGGEYTIPVGNNMQLTTSAKWIFIDEHFTSIEKDPLGFQSSTNRIDASAVLSGEFNSGNPWTLALVGKNLTDELVFNFGNATTLSGVAIYASNIEETRSLALRATIGW